ncbi:superinfection immunity protein [Microbulbifer yueqingensis]|uniref:Superinfection immunity protein n=1 Tax=Microbulbifer yueqingensis TaxID=658219 RepID=A0A1G8V2Z0_9GAMM|nr:superinfection immunity protein [Microbulbifer yueqingensis]SDJ60227.1 Superinfection immunity protein [Microbulbifer yueqingensis]
MNNLFAGDNYGAIAMAFAVVVLLWFLPAVLAFFFNRKHFKLILLACIPAGFSLIAWGGVLAWATTGKVVDKYADRANQASKT